MSTIAMAPPCGDGDADWCHVLGGDFHLLLCSSSSSPHDMPNSRAQDCLPIAAAAPPGPGARGHQTCCKNEVLDEASSDDGAFASAGCFLSPSSLMNLQREDESLYMPMYAAPPSGVVVGDQSYCSDHLLPLPADGALTSLDDALLLAPLSDIDLEAFDNNAADEHKPPPLDDQIIMIPPSVHHHRPFAAAGTRATPPIHGTTTVGQNAGVAVVHAPRHKKAMAIEVQDNCLRRGGATSGGVEMAIISHHHDEHLQASSAVVLVPQPLPPPPSVPRPRGRRSGGGGHRSSSGPAAGKTRLDHIGFEELRKYFYMPITRAAREMNVGLTVLKKRCRELGVARWPHRKMKSLRSLMANVQEMGNGMSPVAVQQELASLETYCALMEEHPWIELTERTKKLRQACFKESYKRRRAAAGSAMEMEMDHIYSFGQQDGHHHQLPPPPTSSADDDRHGQQQSSRFFGY